MSSHAPFDVWLSPNGNEQARANQKQECKCSHSSSQRFQCGDSSHAILSLACRVLRDGSEVLRDSRTGDVLAEILLQSADSNNKVPVLATFVSPWPLASGTVFDVECRNPKTGDGAFLAVTSNTEGKSVSDLRDSFFVDQLIGPTGRFSSYGTPTDVKVKGSSVQGAYRIIDLSFATLSQSTQTEIPRRARVVATIPDGTKQAVMLIGSASALRWNKGSKDSIVQVADSFRAIPAPTTALRMRAKARRSS
jgi:hypothetical protein